MGLLDGALGDAVGKMMGGNAANAQGALGGLLNQIGGANGTNNNVLGAVMNFVQEHGGVQAIVEQFRAGGMSDVVNSWVGTGANAPINASQITEVLGNPTIGKIAAQMGVDPTQASSALSTVLPELINHLTPSGAVDAGSSDLLTKGLSMLKGLTSK